jgi:DNA polymerase III alpha subunit
MFPESHAFAFGVTAYQASWLKYHHPLEFFVGIFNQQPMGFYSLETFAIFLIFLAENHLNQSLNDLRYYLSLRTHYPFCLSLRYFILFRLKIIQKHR